MLYVTPACGVKSIVPVGTAHVGCVNVAAGTAGVLGIELMSTLIDALEVHPTEFVTMKVYVFGGSPLKVALDPVPLMDAPIDGVIVHVPDEGKPLKSTLPVPTAHVGCVIVPTTGAVGSGLITIVAIPL